MSYRPMSYVLRPTSYVLRPTSFRPTSFQKFYRQSSLSLIISKPTHLRNVFRQADNLMAIAILVVVPYIQHHILTVFGNDGGITVKNSRGRGANNVAGYQFVVG